MGAGITPAYAGKRGTHHSSPGSHTDHPRLRGEKYIPLHTLGFASGSPPPTRGKGRLSAAATAQCGITPAYAGKSFVRHLAQALCQDHPRLRGEKVDRSGNHRLVIGSPPPTRGKGVSFAAAGRSHRITPAYAGKRRHRGQNGDSGEDHPRLRGEKLPDLVHRSAGRGSPPPARGKGVLDRQKAHHGGITPACAGKSIVDDVPELGE